uniref:Tyrosine-protein kinase receptor n=1 Tax=Glossina brevipalpis TaxID=37001 RepID=A0A1A9WAH8_9MUSC
MPSIRFVNADDQEFDDIALNDSFTESFSSSLSFNNKKASRINDLQSNLTYFDEPDSNDSDYNERIVDNVTATCLRRCINEETLFINDFGVECLTGDMRKQCFRSRCSKGCQQWWQALKESETCQEACASVQFYPYDLPCISACETSQSHYWHLQRVLVETLIETTIATSENSKPQLLVNGEVSAMQILTLKWPVTKQFSGQHQHHHVYHYHLANRLFNIQYQYVEKPIPGQQLEQEENPTETWWNLLDYSCNDEFVCDINGLTPYATYKFENHRNLVSAKSTPPWGKPLSEPIIKKALALDHKRIVLFWQPGELMNGPLTNYKLILKDSNQNVKNEQMLPPNYSNYIFNNLLPQTNYNLQISMINGEGEGPSAFTFIKTEQDIKVSDNTEESNLVLVVGEYAIILKSLESLTENRVLLQIDEIISDFDYHQATKQVYVVTTSGEIYSFHLDDPRTRKPLISISSQINFKAEKLAIDWLQRKLYITGQSGGKGKIICSNFDGTEILTILRNLPSSLKQIAVDPTNGWLFLLEYQGRMWSVDLATKAIKVIATEQITNFYNDFKRYMLVVSNEADKGLYEISYDGRYVHQISDKLKQDDIQAITYLGGHTLLATNGTNLIRFNYETNEQYNWLVDEVEWCSLALPVQQSMLYGRQSVPLPKEPPKHLQAVLTAKTAKISWECKDCYGHEFQTLAAWNKFEYELEIMDVASNSAFNIRNIKTRYFQVERLQANNQYKIRVRASSAAGRSEWSEELTISTWPRGDHKLLWATENGLYESNEMGQSASPKGSVKDHIKQFVKVNSTVFYMRGKNRNLECFNIMTATMKCNFKASHVSTFDYDWRVEKIYWSDLQRRCVLRSNFDGSQKELLPIFEARQIRVDSNGGFLYYQSTNRLARRPLSGFRESEVFEYYRLQSNGEKLLGFALNFQQKFIYWLVNQQRGLIKLYKAQLETGSSTAVIIDDHEIMEHTIEYIKEIKSLMWLKAKTRHAVVMPVDFEKHYAEFNNPLNLKAYNVKLGTEPYTFQDLNVLPQPVDVDSIAVSEGYWDEFQIKWSPVVTRGNFTVFYKLLFEFEDDKVQQIMTFEVDEPLVHIANFNPTHQLINVTVVPHTYWAQGPPVSKELLTPLSSAKPPRNLRIFIEKLMKPLWDEANLTTIVRWDSVQYKTRKDDIFYKVYCWQDKKLIVFRDVDYVGATTHEARFVNLLPQTTYSFQVQALALADRIGKEKSSWLTYQINPEVQSVPKLIYTTSQFIAEFDIDLNATQPLVYISSEVEHLCFMSGENRLIWVNENVELMSYTPGFSALKLARMRAEVLSLTVDWVQRIVYWAELTGDAINNNVAIYQLNLCSYDGRVMQGSKLLTTEPKKWLRNLLILPFSHTLLWLEHEHNRSIAVLRGLNLTDMSELHFKISGNIFYLFEDSLSPEMETVNIVDSDGKLCSYDIQRQFCTILKLPNIANKESDHWQRDAGYIYRLYEKSLQVFNRRKQTLDYMIELTDVKLIKAFNYQEYPKKECLLPQNFTLNNKKKLLKTIKKFVKYKADTFLTFVFPKQSEMKYCTLPIPDVKYSLTVFDHKRKVVGSAVTSNGSVNITDLLPFANYTVSIAVTSYYQKKMNLTSVTYPLFPIGTMEGTPWRPRNLSALAVNPKEIRITWSEPEKLNARRVFYELHWQLKNSSLKISRIVNGSACFLFLNNMEPSHEYTIWLDAYSSLNKRNSTKQITVHTYDLPKNLILIDKQANNLTFRWERNLENINSVHLIGRPLLLTSDIVNFGRFDIDITYLKEDIKVTDLIPKTKYEFHLKLFYKGSRERFYLWPEQRHHRFIYETLASAPSSPGQPKIEHITGEIFKVYWEPARNNGAPIVEYSLEALQALYAYNSNKRIRRSIVNNSVKDDDNLQMNPSSKTLKVETLFVEELPPLEDTWFAYCNTLELSCIVREVYTKHLLMFRVRARNEIYGWGPYSKESVKIIEPFVSPQKRQSLILAIVAPAVIVSSCVLILMILRKLQKRRVKTKKLLKNSRPSIWSNLSSFQQQTSSHRRSLTSSSTWCSGGPLSDADIALLPHIQWSQITLLNFLGSGAFGEVYEGLVKHENREEAEKVAIKSLRKGASEFAELLQEAQLMSNFRHENIVRLIGVCCDAESISIIMEHMEGGDLLTYLRDSRSSSPKPSVSFQLWDLIKMCIDVATGMSYLEDMHFVHRDLACRNCLLTSREESKRIVKIGDFGLARDLYKSDYYRKEGEGLLPVRWMAPESLVDGIFTIQTDIWAFGILCWEILTLGRQPYAGRNNFEVLNFVKDGGRLDQPPNCPDKLFTLMMQCWSKDPDARPTFRHCLNTLLGIKTYVRRLSLIKIKARIDGELYANTNGSCNSSLATSSSLNTVDEEHGQFSIVKPPIPKVHFDDNRDSKEYETEAASDISELLDRKLHKVQKHPDYFVNEGISRL